jgi:hypothetical protein
LSLSEYIQQVLIEAMKLDIDEGNFCDVLLEKIRNHENNINSKNNNNKTQHASRPSEPMNGNTDMIKKLAT